MKIAQLKLGRLGSALHCGLSLAPTTHHVWLAGVVGEDNFMKCRESRVILHSQRPDMLCLIMWLGLLAPTTHHLAGVVGRKKGFEVI